MRIEAILERLRELDCNPQPATRETEIAALELRLGRRLPTLYRALVVGYTFSPAVIGQLELFGNGCDNPDEDITSASILDKHLLAWLTPRGAISIGRPATGAYDPVCFNMVDSPADPSIVVFDHEDILQGRVKVRCRTVAGSFAELLGLP